MARMCGTRTIGVEVLGDFAACVEPIRAVEVNGEGNPAYALVRHELTFTPPSSSTWRGSKSRSLQEATFPASYTIDTDRRLVVTRIWGAATEEEVLDHGQRLRNDPQFNPDYRQLVDMSELTEIKVGSDMIRDASRKQFFSPGVRRALVASSDAAFGMARMYAIASEAAGQTIEVFRDLKTAEVWLNG
jgi:hypothetical protein